MKNIILILAILFQTNNSNGANLLYSQTKCLTSNFLISNSSEFSISKSYSFFNYSNEFLDLKTSIPPSHWNEPDHTTGFHIGGFFLGLFLPVIGIYIANRIGGKAKENRKKWAVIGTGITLGILLISLLSKSTKY